MTTSDGSAMGGKIEQAEKRGKATKKATATAS
jgi:hypothetical protein